MLSAEFCVAGLMAESSEDAIRALAGRLFAAGKVRPSFEGAATARERRSPTGLPFADVAVAMPHAEPEHVISPALAVASLARPVRFRQMGSPGVVLEVGLVVMPAFTVKEQAAAELSRVVDLLQDDTLRRLLVGAPNGAVLHEVLASHWGA